MSPSKVSHVAWNKFYNIIDGQNVLAKSARQGTNPATSEKLWDYPIGTQEDVDRAVKVGRAAFRTWSKTPISKRKELLQKFSDALAQHEEELTTLLCMENGKPRPMANREVKGMAISLEWYASQDLPTEQFEDDEKVVYTRYVPLGVVGAIIPWNFPCSLVISKIGPALLTGNVVIVKPSPFTPYCGLKICEIAQEIFPPGVVQAVGGDDSIGPMLTTHPDIDKISFTGSIPTGKKVMESCAKTLKRVTLELGGNDPTIVLPDVDIDKVAAQVALGAFRNSGQVCIAIKRIYIHSSIYRPFVDALVKHARAMKVGGFDEEGVALGPLQNEMQYGKVKAMFKDTKDNGYTFALGEPDIAASKGYFVHPAIIDNPPEDSQIVREEPFGPIVPTLAYDDVEDAIARANDTRTGLGASVWGKDAKKAFAVAERLEAGSVFVNSFEKPSPKAFFSGHKESGIGGSMGMMGIIGYTNAHVIHEYKQT